MQKGKRYRDTTVHCDCEVVAVDGDELTFRYPGRGRLYRHRDTVANDLTLGWLVELPDEQPSQYFEFRDGAWVTPWEQTNKCPAQHCTHTNPDGSAAWVNQGFMHVLMACRMCGQKQHD